jgi:nitrogen fixation NifU-like protein
MEEFRELYQEVILDHNKNPRNFREIKEADYVKEGLNPLCGDHYTLYLILKDDIIEDIAFKGAGCAISKASASLMSSVMKGKTRKEAEKIFQLFHKVVTGELDPHDHLDELGKLAAFAGVAEFPMRVKCATLAWHTLHAALSEEDGLVTTE